MDNIKDDFFWMQHAIALAKQAEQQGEIPVGAVLVLENQLIGEGFNSMIFQHDPTAHAEIIALREAARRIENYRLLNATLYVTLEPCMMCAGALLHSRIKKVVYGAADYKTGALGSFVNLFTLPSLNHYIEVEGGVLAQECSALLSEFFKKRRLEKKHQKES